MKDKRIIIFTAIALTMTSAVAFVWSFQEKGEKKMVPIEELREKEEEVVWEEIEVEEIEIKEEPEPEYHASKLIPLKNELQIFTHRKCDEYAVSYPLILALMESESTFLEAVGNERILGGEEGGPRYYGYMQLSAGKIKEAKEKYDLDAHTPEGNIEMAIILMAQYHLKYNDTELEITAYKAGEGAADEGERVNCTRIIERTEIYELITKEGAICTQE